MPTSINLLPCDLVALRNLPVAPGDLGLQCDDAFRRLGGRVAAPQAAQFQQSGDVRPILGTDLLELFVVPQVVLALRQSKPRRIQAAPSRFPSARALLMLTPVIPSCINFIKTSVAFMLMRCASCVRPTLSSIRMTRFCALGVVICVLPALRPGASLRARPGRPCRRQGGALSDHGVVGAR